MASDTKKSDSSNKLGLSTPSCSSNVNSRSSNHQGCCQTVPKAIDKRTNLAQVGNLQDISQQRGSAFTSGMQQVVNSLTAPERFTDYITVEPLAFLAILSLYIEFPSIQDLIYTKICLQVVSQHSQLDMRPISSFNSSRIYQAGVSATIDQNVTIAPQILPDTGRIQSYNNSINTAIFESNPINNNYQSICDRLNKTAVPKSVQEEIKDIDSKFWLIYQIIICSLCFLANPQWGGISDRFGRLLPLNVPIITSALTNLISLTFGLLICFDLHALFQIEWLYLGATLVGISGGQGVIIANAVSYISDNTANESRSKRITVLESVIFLAQSVGFLISKFLMKLGLAPPNQPWLNRHFAAFSICVLLNIICIFYSVMRLRHRKFHRFMNNFEREQQEATMIGESMCSLSQTTGWERSVKIAGQSTMMSSDKIPEMSSSTLDDIDRLGGLNNFDYKWWNVFTFAHYRETFLSATKPREARLIILLILLATFMSALSLATLLSLLYVYLISDPFNWSTSDYSQWNSINSITRSVALVCLTLCMKFIKTWSVPDPLVALVGFLSKGAGLLMIGFAKSSVLVSWSILAFVFSEYSLPPLRSLLSKLVLKDERAKIFSCLSALQNLCFLFGNIAFYMTYTSVRVEGYFRIAFITVAVLELFTVILMLIIHVNLRQRVLIV